MDHRRLINNRSFRLRFCEFFLETSEAILKIKLIPFGPNKLGQIAMQSPPRLMDLTGNESFQAGGIVEELQIFLYEINEGDQQSEPVHQWKDQYLDSIPEIVKNAEQLH